MSRFHKCSMASAVALVMSLTACGGGGGSSGGSGPVSTPPPTPAPTPTPTPTPTGTLGTIGAPATAATAPTVAPVMATAGGPNFAIGPAAGTVFPLLQTTLVVDELGISADPAANAKGGTATVVGGGLEIDMLHAHAGMAGSHGFAGTPPDLTDNLDWTRVGYWSTGGVWDYFEGPLRHRGVFVAGYQTPAAAVPTSGTAAYSGKASGYIFLPALGSGSLLCKCDEVAVIGDAAFTANFGTRTLIGSMTGMTVPHPWDEAAARVPWHSVGFAATMLGNGFSGTTSVSSSTPSHVSLNSGATGTIVGNFFGPAAQEAGAIWTLFDGTNSVIGTLTGKRP